MTDEKISGTPPQVKGTKKPEPRPLPVSLQVAEELKAAALAQIAKEPEAQASLLDWCGYPTDFTRCSPFFPLPPDAQGKRRYFDYDNKLKISSAGWGEIFYQGPQLSIFEEDVLMALLTVLQKKGPHQRNAYVLAPLRGEEGPGLVLDPDKDEPPPPLAQFSEEPLIYKGHLLPLLRLLYKTGTPSARQYASVMKALYLLQEAIVELFVSRGKTKSGKKRPPLHLRVQLVGGVYYDPEKQEVAAAINPFFYTTYIQGRFTLLSLQTRRKLKGSIAKALYRFVMSQKDTFRGHFLTLAAAVNLSLPQKSQQQEASSSVVASAHQQQPSYQIRRQLKTAIAELVKAGVLTEKSHLGKGDIVALHRVAPGAKAPVQIKQSAAGVV